MASCSCIPPPASLKPRKIYNLLVPDVFSLTAPPLDEPVNTSTKRKIGKLQEYVQKNPGKAGKVGQAAGHVNRGLQLKVVRTSTSTSQNPRCRAA